MPPKRRSILLTIAGIGVAAHLMILRYVAYCFYPAPADRSFVNSFVVNAGFSLLGGGFYALFLRRPIAQSISRGRTSVLEVFKGGLWGTLATVTAFQVILLAAASFLTLKMKVGVPESELATNFLLALLEVETYGLIQMFYILIPAFGCGAIATAVAGHLPLLRTNTEPS